jgi:hypothetical protein
MKTYITIPFILTLINCSTISITEVGDTKKQRQSSEYSIHIGYEFYYDNLLYDQPMQISDGIIDVPRDYKLCLNSLEKEFPNSKVSVDSPSAENQIELNVIFKNNSSFILAFISGLTFTIIPAYFDTDVEIHASSYNRKNKATPKNVTNSGKMRTYFGIIPLIGLPFSSSFNNRETLINNLVKKSIHDLGL